jgi:opacity protein-like surface antigen
MRIGFSSSCAIGLAIALTVGGVSTVKAQQTDSTRRTTRRMARSAQRIPISKERAAEPAPAPAPTVNQDSIAAAERARQDSIAAVERARQDSIARVEQMKRDSIAAAERRRQDSVAAVEKARQDSIARVDSIARAEAARIAMRRGAGGFYLGIAAGASVPNGDITSGAANTGGYGTGWNVTVPIGYDFPQTMFGLRVDGSFDRLAGKNFNTAFNAPDLTAWSANLDAKIRVPLGRTFSRFYVLGGATTAKFTGFNRDFTDPNAPTSQQTFSDASWKWGWNAGAGFNFNFGRMTGLFVESRYISVSPDAVTGFPYSSAHWIPVVLGIQF